jgi:WD40 repeat protein
MSIVSRELFAAAVLLGGVGSLIMAEYGRDGREQAGRSALQGHDGVIESLAFAADGKTLVSCGWDRTVRTWAVGEGRPDAGRELDTLRSENHLFGVAITPDGRYLAAGGSDTFHLWERDPASGWVPRDLGARGSYRSVAVSPDGRILAVGRGNGSIELWDPRTRKLLDILGWFSDDVRKVEISKDGAHVAGTTFAGEFQAWEVSPAATTRRLAFSPEHVQIFAFAGDGRSVAISQFSPRLKSLGLWDMETGRCKIRFSDNQYGVNALAVSPDGRTLASADVDESIRLWDVTTGKLKGRIHEDVGWVKTLTFSPDGRRIAFGGRDSTVQVRLLETAASTVGSDPT